MLFSPTSKSCSTRSSTASAFGWGSCFYVEPEKFKRLYRLYDALYLSAAFALFTTVAVFLMPIIALYTAGVTDAEYLDTRLLVLFTAVELLFSDQAAVGDAAEHQRPL